VATATWVAGLYGDLVMQSAPGARQGGLRWAETEERSVVLAALPPVAEEFYNDLFTYRFWEVRAGLQGIAEFDARQVLLPGAPAAFDQVEWQRFAGTQVALATSEENAGLRPVIPLRAWDEADWQRAFAGLSAFLVEGERAAQVPSVPPPVPNLGWDDFEWGHDFGARGLGALVLMDEFVNAPLGSGTGGAAARGRAARFGFALPAFR